jgi:glycerol-3-phosphate dehydrogenase
MYDLIVVGGGLLGVGITRDAALRGLSVCLFEQEDFGTGATSRGSRLVTGGLQALETLDFTRVREDIREREILIQTAPHLAFPQPCLIPFYSQGLIAQTRLRASFALTDALGFDPALPVHHLLSPAEARARMPSLRTEGLTGAALVWEAAVPQIERLALETALDARRQGAALRTQTWVEALCAEPGRRGRERVTGVRWTDRLTGESGETKAELVILAAGAWQAALETPRAHRPSVPPRLRKSIAVIGPPLPGRGDALVFPQEEDGPTLSVLTHPWGVWIGSVETEFSGDLDTAHATGAEVAALLDRIKNFLPEIAPGELTLAQAAVSAPLPVPSASFGVPAPTYEIRDHGAEGSLSDGLLSVTGGRVANVRGIAEEAVDLACRKLGRSLSTPPCRTASVPLAAPARPHFEEANDLQSAVEWAVAEEECRTLRDFLLRRSPLGWAADQGRSVLPVVLETLTAWLGWDTKRQVREVKAFEAEIALTQAFRVL